jgi:acyl transferase domain-containing protein
MSIFRTKQLPPNVHLSKRNPAIHWDEHKLRVALEPETLAARHSSGNLLVSICSSGIGGVNAHVVVESYERSEELVSDAAAAQTQGPVLLVAAGLSPRSTAAVAEDITKLLKTDLENAVDYSVIYGRRARQMTWRSFGVKNAGQDTISFSTPSLGPRSKPPIAFLFSGQGPQHINSMWSHPFASHPFLMTWHLVCSGSPALRDISCLPSECS